MVNDQMAQAIDMAKSLGSGAIPAPGQRQRLPAGGRVMVALMNAAGNKCPCIPCRLLRVEASQMSEMALGDIGDDGGSTDTQPA